VTLRLCHALGVRHASLTHNCLNRFADVTLLERPARVAESRWHGVSDEGRSLVREMNRVGLIVDLSHASADTTTKVLGGGRCGCAASLAPTPCAHIYATCPTTRCA